MLEILALGGADRVQLVLGTPCAINK